MKVAGKILGAGLGFLLAGGPFGAIVGFIVGHYFDRGRASAKTNAKVSPKQLDKIQRTFFTTLFTSLGHLAKADGRVSEAEIAHAESVIKHMGLGSEQRQIAINLFQQGKSNAFNLHPVIKEFARICQNQQMLLQMYMELIIQGSLCDGQIHPKEMQILKRIAKTLGFRRISLQIMIQRVQAEQYFHQFQNQHSNHNQLTKAYHVLELEQNAPFSEVKKAYRRLMAQHHPDKLAARGLPDSMQRIAHEKSLEIKQAYELIKQQHQG